MKWKIDIMTNDVQPLAHQILRLIVWKEEDGCMSVLHQAHAILIQLKIDVACSPLSIVALHRNEEFAQNFQAVAG